MNNNFLPENITPTLSNSYIKSQPLENRKLNIKAEFNQIIE